MHSITHPPHLCNLNASFFKLLLGKSGRDLCFERYQQTCTDTNSATVHARCCLTLSSVIHRLESRRYAYEDFKALDKLPVIELYCYCCRSGCFGRHSTTAHCRDWSSPRICLHCATHCNVRPCDRHFVTGAGKSLSSHDKLRSGMACADSCHQHGLQSERLIITCQRIHDQKLLISNFRIPNFKFQIRPLKRHQSRQLRLGAFTANAATCVPGKMISKVLNDKRDRDSWE